MNNCDVCWYMRCTGLEEDCRFDHPKDCNCADCVEERKWEGKAKATGIRCWYRVQVSFPGPRGKRGALCGYRGGEIYYGRCSDCSDFIDKLKAKKRASHEL